MTRKLDTHMRLHSTAVADERDALARLAYELLDAHHDTACLVREPMTSTLDWESHLVYLRNLQRVGRELLARVAP